MEESVKMDKRIKKLDISEREDLAYKPPIQLKNVHIKVNTKYGVVELDLARTTLEEVREIVAKLNKPADTLF